MSDLYKLIIKIRVFEELILELFSKNKLSGTTHTYIGEEATAVAIMQHINKNDFIFSNHRCHGHYLAYGGPEKELLAEIMSKKTGLCQGKGGSQHIHYKNFFTNGIQGGIVPNALGIALSKKIKKEQGNVIVFLGDGTLGQGVVYESLNLASILNCKIMFVIEDNKYAMSTRREDVIFGDIKSRIEGFGVKTFEIESTDVDKLFSFFGKAFSYMNDNNAPVCTIIHNYRLVAHSKGDDTRPIEEINHYKKFDPLSLIEKKTSKDYVNETYRIFRNDLLKIVDDLYNEDSIIINSDFNQISINKKSQLNILESRYVDLIRAQFEKELGENKNILFIGEDIRDPYGGAFKATKGLSTKYNEQLLNMPISEASMIGMAVGLSLNGIIPVVEMMFGDFITLGFDQIINHASKYAWIYGNDISTPLIIRVPSGAKRGYGPTHSQSLEKFLIGIPFIKIIALSAIHNPKEIYHQLFNTIDCPTVVIENKKLYAEKSIPFINGRNGIFYVKEYNNFGYSTLHLSIDFSSKPDIYIITYGGMVCDAMDSVEELVIKEEIQADLVIISQLSPIPIEDFKEIIPNDAIVLTVEEGTKSSGIGAELIASFIESHIGKTFFRIATPNMPIPNGIALESQIIPQKKDIVKKVKKILGTIV